MTTDATAGVDKKLALALLAVTQFVLILDAGIVNIALPSIGDQLAFPNDQLAWVSNAYSLAFGGLLLLGGRLADLLGPRRVFVIGFGVFTVASLAGGFADDPLWLVASRVGQGLGAAMISPAALAMIMIIFSAGGERNKAIGVFFAMAGLGGATGFVVGGVLTQSFGWPAVFWVNVPIGLAMLALAPRLLPSTVHIRHGGTFDLTGAITVTGGLSLLVYGVIDANSAGWGSAQTILVLAGAVVLLVLFVTVEARGKNPLIPLGFFLKRAISGANVVGVLLTMSIFPFFFFLTLYMQQVRGFSPLVAAFGQLPMSVVGTVAAAMIAPRLAARFGFRATLAGGLVVSAVGLAWFSMMSFDGTYLVDVLGPSLVIGLGWGLAMVSVGIAGTAAAEPHEAGLASGLIDTAQQVGGVLGLSVLVAISTQVAGSAMTSGVASPELVDGFRAALLTAAAFALVGALVTMSVLQRPQASPPQAAPVEPPAVAIPGGDR